MEVIGETHLELSRNGRSLSLQALVVKDLDVKVRGGILFMPNNDITIRPAKHQILFSNVEICSYGDKYPSKSLNAVCFATSGIL